MCSYPCCEFFLYLENYYVINSVILVEKYFSAIFIWGNFPLIIQTNVRKFTFYLKVFFLFRFKTFPLHSSNCFENTFSFFPIFSFLFHCLDRVHALFFMSPVLFSTLIIGISFYIKI